MKKDKHCKDGLLKLKQLEEMQHRFKSLIGNVDEPTACAASTNYENFPKLLVKKLDPSAIIPTKANGSDAGYDLYALDGAIVEKNTHRLIKTGISMAIPEGYVGLIWPRSGLAYKHGLDVFAGVIDSGYRGDIGVILFNSQYSSYGISKGDRIAQILIQKVEDFELLEVEDLDSTERNSGGFGSSGI
jgi:dUTP pyrophosphatase